MIGKHSLLVLALALLLGACGSGGDSGLPSSDDGGSQVDDGSGDDAGSGDDDGGAGDDGADDDGSDDGADDGSDDGADDDGSGDDGGGGDDAAGVDDIPAFAALQCDLAASGPMAGALDPVQSAMVDQLGGNFAAIPEVGPAAQDLVVGTARFLDIVDALAASGTVLFTEQDPAAGGDALDGTAHAVQCGAKSLAAAFVGSPLAAALPAQSETLVTQLAELTLVFDGPDSIGLEGLADLTDRLAGIADTLSGMVDVVESFPGMVPADLDALPPAFPAEAFVALARAPAVLLADLAEVLRDAGSLDGQGTADAIALTLTDLLATATVFDATGTVPALVETAQGQLAEGLGLILEPLFAAIAEALGGGAGATFPDFLAGGIDGFPGGANPLEALLGGAQPGTDALASQLAGVPVLGDVLGLLVASAGGDFDFTDPAAGADLLAAVLAGDGPQGFGSLADALTTAAEELTALAPAALDPTAGAPGSDPEALGTLLALLADNPLSALLADYAGALGGDDVPAYAPADLAASLEGLFASIVEEADGGLFGSLLDLLGDLVNTLLGVLGDNPLAALLSAVFTGFTESDPSLTVNALESALEEALGGFAAFAPAD